MNKEILNLAYAAQPELMQKTAMALKLTERMDPDFAQDLLQEFEVISEVTMEKAAAAPVSALSKVLQNPAGQKAIGVAAMVGAGVAASLGTAIAGDLYDAARRGLTKSRTFKRIMEFDPSLKNVPASGNKNLKNTFSMLHRFAPDFTSDPVLGASILRSLVSVPVGNERDQIEKLIGSRKNLLDVKKNQFQPDFRGGKGGKGGMGNLPAVHVHLGPSDLKQPGATQTND